MARPSVVSDLDIFRALRQLQTQQQAAGGASTPPTPYAIRKLFLGTVGNAPSYGRIRDALQRFATLDAAGARFELPKEPAPLEDNVTDKLTDYLAGLLRPVVVQLLAKAQQDASTGEAELATQLERVSAELEEVRTQAQTTARDRDRALQQLASADTEQSALRAQLTEAAGELQAASATITQQATEIDYLKKLHQQERQALEQQRRETQQALTRARDELAALTIEHGNALKTQTKSAHDVANELQERITVLTGRVAQLDEQMAGMDRERRSLQQQLSASASSLRAMTSDRDQLAAQLTGLREASAQHRTTLEQALTTRDHQLEALRQELVERRVDAERATERADGLATTIAELKTQLQLRGATATGTAPHE